MRLQCSHLGKAFGVALLLAATMAVTTTHAAFINLTPTNGANSASSVKLSDLISGDRIDGIIVGDKKMSGFRLLAHWRYAGRADINVLGFKDPRATGALACTEHFSTCPAGHFRRVAFVSL